MRKIINAMQLKRFNVKQKFAIIIIVLVLVFSLVFSLGYYLIYSLLLDSLIINQYQSLGIVKQEISQYFTGINKKIDEFTSTPSVREYLYGYSDPQDERFLIRFKKDLHESTAMPFLNSVFVIKKDSYLGSNYNSQIDNDNIDDLIEYIKSKYSRCIRKSV